MVDGSIGFLPLPKFAAGSTEVRCGGIECPVVCICWVWAMLVGMASDGSYESSSPTASPALQIPWFNIPLFSVEARFDREDSVLKTDVRSEGLYSDEAIIL